MNIFILDKDIQTCARYHCDRHVNKMILESVQILCTVLNERGFVTPYKSTHRQHPCIHWVNRSYEKDRDHASIKVLGDILHHRYESLGLTEFAQAMPDHYKVSGDPVAAYRAYYLGEKDRFARWSRPNSASRKWPW